MMTYRALLLFIGLVLAAATAPNAAGQSSSDGSLYSRFGIGELQTFSSSQIQAMGGSGFGLHSLNYLNLSNPGTWSDQVLTRASAGFTYQTLRITDVSANESRLASGYLNGVQFSFPILQRKLGLAIGFVPYSRVGYRVREEDTIFPSDPEPDTVAYAIDHEGSGGLQRVTAGLGYRLNGNVSVGISADGIFGIVENGRRTSFFETDPGSQFIDTNVRIATRLTGIAATAGALVSARNMLRDEDFFSLGIAVTSPTTLSGERVRTLGESLDRDTLGAVLSGNVSLPWRLRAGVAYHPSSRWTVTAGGRYEPWTNFRSDFALPGYVPGEDNGNFSDRLQAGAGVEFLPAGTDLLETYFSRIGYRLGFLYDQSYVSPRADVDVRTFAVTGGLSLPTMMSGTRLDVNIQVGTRGTTNDDLVHDLFYRVSANVNIGERWFQTPKLR